MSWRACLNPLIISKTLPKLSSLLFLSRYLFFDPSILCFSIWSCHKLSSFMWSFSVLTSEWDSAKMVAAAAVKTTRRWSGVCETSWETERASRCKRRVLKKWSLLFCSIYIKATECSRRLSQLSKKCIAGLHTKLFGWTKATAQQWHSRVSNGSM